MNNWTPWSILSATGGAGVTTEGWNLAESAEEPRTFVTEVIFSAPFQSVPVVQLALTGFDMDQRDSGRISIKAVEVSPGRLQGRDQHLARHPGLCRGVQLAGDWSLAKWLPRKDSNLE